MEVTVQDRLQQLRIDLVELRRAHEWLHRLYYADHLLSYAHYTRQCRENETMLVKLLERIRALEREATGEGQAQPRPDPTA